MPATTSKPYTRNGGSSRQQKAKPAGEVVHTKVFDSVGPNKYALQIRKAGNGNPFLKIVEGVPQGDGTFRKFHVTVWSEDFDRFFSMLDELRCYIAEHNVRTPEGHTYDPHKKRQRRKARA